MENIINFLNDFSLLIVAVSATIVAIIKSYKNTNRNDDEMRLISNDKYRTKRKSSRYSKKL